MPTNSKAVVILQMPEALKTDLDAYAYAHDLSISEAVRRAIQLMLGQTVETPQHGNKKYTTVEERRHEKYLRRKARTQC